MTSGPRNPFNPGLAEGVRRVGFRKWYERELLSSHAHLLLALLSSIGLIGVLEAFSGGSVADKLLGVALFIVSGAIGYWALGRYFYLLMHAEDVANQASCPRCEAYARFDLIGERPRDGQVRVRCRQCWHVWDISA